MSAVSWADRFLAHVRDHGDRDALRVPGRSWTFARLGAGARRVADELTGLGVGPGMMAAVAIARGPGFVFALCGAKLAGAVPVVLDPTDPAHAAAVAARLGVAAALVEGGGTFPAGEGRATIAVEAASDLELVAHGRAMDGARRLGDGISHVIHTSGSTSAGKSAVWTEWRAARYLALRPPLGAPGPDDCAGVVAPLSSALGFPAVLRGLVHGRTLALVAHPFPLALEAIADLGASGFSCTPTHAELILRSAQPIPPRVRIIALTSAPIGPDRLAAFAARVSPARVTVSYGLTEIGPVTHLRAGELAEKAHTVGRPIPGRLVMVVDRKRRPLPAGQTGHVIVRVRALPGDGYLDPGRIDGRRFRRGLLWTGDRGHFDADGFLVLEGRAAELLKVGGRLVSGPRIEEELAAGGRVGAVAVVGAPHPELGQVAAAVYVPRPDRPLACEELATDRLRQDELPRWVLPRRRLPHTATGKLRRGLLAAEVGRWVALWPTRASHDGALVPCREIDAGGDPVAIVDAPRIPPWAGRPPADPCARPLAIVHRRSRRTIGLAWIRAGLDAASSGVRLIAGPILAPGADPGQVAAAAGFLAQAAVALPGPAARAVLVEPGGGPDSPVGSAWRAAGFVPLRGAPGWLWRAELGDAEEAALSVARRVGPA